MKLAVVVFFIAVTIQVVAVDITDLSPEMLNRVRSVGSKVTDIQPPSSVEAPPQLTMADCFDLAFRHSASFRQVQKEYLDARGKLWVAEQKVFYVASGNTEYRKESGADAGNTLSGNLAARWERVDGSSIRASLSAGSDKDFGDFFSGGPGVNLSYERPLYQGVGKASSTAERIRSAKSALLSSELSFYDAYQELAQRVVEDYCAVLLARGEVEISERAVERAKQLYDINYVKFSGEGIALPGEAWVSQVAEIDVDQARLAWDRAKQQLLSRQQTYQDTLDRLLLTMGVTPGGNPKLTTAITFAPQDYDEAALVKTALANSTELGRFKQSWEDAQATRRIARSEQLPNVIASVGVDNLGRNSADSSGGTTWYTGIRVELPLKNRALAEAMEALNTLKADNEVRITQVKGDVTIAEEAFALANAKAKAELEKIQAQIHFAEGELARADSELARNKRLAALNYIPGTKLRAAEEAYQRKQFELEQQRAELDNAKLRTTENLNDQQHALNLARLSLVSTKASADEDLENARVKVAGAQRTVNEAKKKIEQCTVTSPVTGLVVVGTNTENWPERRPYRLGDQVSSRTAPVIVYDLKQMQVRCQIGEMDIERVRVGQEVLVSSSTQQTKRYRGKIAIIEELAREANVWQGGTPGKRIFGVLIKLGETDPGNLRPGMTVDMEIVLESVHNACTVPIRAVFKEGEHSVVYRLNGKTFETVPVTTGIRNDLQIAIDGNIHEGDIISLDRVQTSPEKTAAGMPKKQHEQVVVNTTVKKGDLLFIVNQSGMVAAKRSIPVVPEISGRIQWVCNDGIKVAGGTVLVRLETRQAQENLVNLQARKEEVQRRLQRETDVGNARTKQGRLEVTRAEDGAAAFKRQNEVALQQAQRQIEFHEKELEQRQQNVTVKRKLAAKGLLAGSEVEREVVAVRSAEFALQKERSNYQLMKSQLESAATERDKQVNDVSREVSRNRTRTSREIRMAKNELDNLQLQIDRARTDLAKMTLTAPAGGLVMLTMQSGQGNARPLMIGDYVNQGRDVAAIVSLDQLQVKLELDQTQITGIKIAQGAEVTIDALAGQVLKGKVTAIGQTARRPPVQGWTGVSAYTTFPVTIDLPPARSSPIRPGMRAGVSIIVRKIPDAVMIPTECIFMRNGKPTVFVERHGTYARVAVKVGDSNGEYTVVNRGLAVGERITLHDLDESKASSTATKESQR